MLDVQLKRVTGESYVYDIIPWMQVLGRARSKQSPTFGIRFGCPFHPGSAGQRLYGWTGFCQARRSGGGSMAAAAQSDN
jgi:hypothetical protein